MEGNCKCFHHSLNKVIVVLVWLSALGFWWATAFKTTFLWIDGQHFFMDVVVLSLLLLTSKFCGCCGWNKGGGNVCMHGGSCKCGDCGMCK
ncbi:MAG: hypothetical protein A2650_00175 [Candidatus Yanofskybacteria bacterium RIFCSPHIGHO2_01_FULL_41_53]|uniref:Transmembrane protein n=1 Tax=Candidatus Yanofskybacteria bacterium RIFCSPHIGHO2_01_FULL_41_53 TaxID=1802663 RepID=A0A1F8EG81_9BACT|nr:MAG: hypothetical protein A2650_00175 [Candidatus Yanofskybacteria bacterium RIFCSPHIGHO2_01_FULL_41_53]OGN16982.1 MAG: hypothetical protein A3F48_00350 [Candidatus Yanofskybacteria bacterium RIFCSPHIGHO2_12_FULL_41_9]